MGSASYNGGLAGGVQWQVQESELLAQLEERWCQEELPRATTSSFLIPRGIGPASLCLFEAGMETEAGTENISRTWASLAKTMNSRHLEPFQRAFRMGVRGLHPFHYWTQNTSLPPQLLP